MLNATAAVVDLFKFHFEELSTGQIVAEVDEALKLRRGLRQDLDAGTALIPSPHVGANCAQNDVGLLGREDVVDLHCVYEPFCHGGRMLDDRERRSVKAALRTVV